MVSITRGKTPQLSLLQDPSYGIPSDITFQIIGTNTEEETEDRKEVLGEVKGNKVVLGAFSPVFKSMFFGPLKETRDVIPVEQTTLKAFQKIIDYIYQKDIDWSDMTVIDIYDIVNLAEMYHMPDLMCEITDQMANVSLTADTFLGIAHTAVKFPQFPDASSVLLLACAKFLQKMVRTPAEQLQFALDQSGGGKESTTLHLLVLVKDLPTLGCFNCGEEEEKCLDGELVVGQDNFTEGLQLRVNNKCNGWGVEDAGKVFTVISMNTVDLTVKASGNVGERNYYIMSNGTSTFCYNCC